MNMKFLNQTAGNADPLSCRDVVVLHINHLMDNTFYFNEVLNRVFAGLIFIALPYNHRQPPAEPSYPFYFETAEESKEEGRETEQKKSGGKVKAIIKKNNETVGAAGQDFIQTIRLMVEHAIRTELAPNVREGKRLLIIEDGGIYYEAAAGMENRDPMVEQAILGIVEQTTLGTRKCIDTKGMYRYACPCASVAKSDVKMYFESIFIGQRIVEELSGLLRAEDAFFSFYHVLLCGYGIIGRSVAKSLSGRKCEITVVDKDPDILALARREGYTACSTTDKNLFSRDTIWIGCVGAPVFGKEWLFAFLEGQGETLFLASGSSKTVEFESFLHFIEGREPGIEGLVLKYVEPGIGCKHYIFDYHGKSKKIVLIAEGRPVNFYAEKDASLTFQVIDLVFAEMLSLAFYLCSHRNLPARLYLLGTAPEFEEAVSEEALLQEWCSKKNITIKNGIIEYLDGHPLGKQLRTQLLEGIFTTGAPVRGKG